MAGAGQGGQTFSVTGRYLLAAPIRNRAGQGRALFSWLLSSNSANSKQGRAGRYFPGHYILAAPIQNRAGQGRAGQLFSL